MCGCKDRQRLLASAAKNTIKGNFAKAASQVRTSNASALRDAQQLARRAQAAIRRTGR